MVEITGSKIFYSSSKTINIMNDSLMLQRQLASEQLQITSDAYIVSAYLIYLPIAILLTAYVSYKLFKSGKIFMMDIFNKREELANSTNRLFELGFYLINVGFALKILYIEEIANKKVMIEELSSKIGFFAIYLAIMMFMNLFLFFRGKKIAAQRRAEREMYAQALSQPPVQ
jgi:hypothetical protein